jgi:hypothetical protein
MKSLSEVFKNTEFDALYTLVHPPQKTDIGKASN